MKIFCIKNVYQYYTIDNPIDDFLDDFLDKMLDDMMKNLPGGTGLLGQIIGTITFIIFIPVMVTILLIHCLLWIFILRRATLFKKGEEYVFEKEKNGKFGVYINDYRIQKTLMFPASLIFEPKKFYKHFADNTKVRMLKLKELGIN